MILFQVMISGYGTESRTGLCALRGEFAGDSLSLTLSPSAPPPSKIYIISERIRKQREPDEELRTENTVNEIQFTGINSFFSMEEWR